MDSVFGLYAPLATDVVYLIVFTVAVLVLWSLIGLPRWRVWNQHQMGLADLAQARNEQQIQIAKADARLQAAQTNKAAAIIEAEAVAEQVSVIGTQLDNHGLYLRWQWIKMMEENGSSASVIYVPTEGNLPIMEAGRAVQSPV